MDTLRQKKEKSRFFLSILKIPSFGVCNNLSRIKVNLPKSRLIRR